MEENPDNISNDVDSVGLVGGATATMVGAEEAVPKSDMKSKSEFVVCDCCGCCGGGGEGGETTAVCSCCSCGGEVVTVGTSSSDDDARW